MSDEMQVQSNEQPLRQMRKQGKSVSKLALNKTTLRQLSVKEQCYPMASSPACGRSLYGCWL